MHEKPNPDEGKRLKQTTKEMSEMQLVDNHAMVDRTVFRANQIREQIAKEDSESNLIPVLEELVQYGRAKSEKLKEKRQLTRTEDTFPVEQQSKNWPKPNQTPIGEENKRQVQELDAEIEDLNKNITKQLEAIRKIEPEIVEAIQAAQSPPDSWHDTNYN